MSRRKLARSESPLFSSSPAWLRLALPAALVAALVGTLAVAYPSLRPAPARRSASATAQPQAKPPAKLEAKARVAAAARPQLAQLPLAFEANRGQTSAPVQFLARAGGAVVFLTPQGATVKTAQGHSAATAVQMRFAGAQTQAQPQGIEPQATTVSYFSGHSATTSIPTFAQVRYPQIYPGVDLLYYGRKGRLEYDLTLAPGADASRIQLGFAGARPSIATDGILHLGNAMTLLPPVAYQTIAGRRHPVTAHYALRPDRTVAIALGAYDRHQTLIVDPVLQFSTYLGGTQYNKATTVAVDTAGSAYVAGYTLSTDFPTVAGSYQTILNAGNYDAFVTKLSADGTSLVYSTYLGGGGDDEAAGIAVDSAGDAYVTGFTSSSTANVVFPTTTGAYQVTNAGGYDAFVTKLNPTGTALLYSTYLGGVGNDQTAGIAVDASGDAFVTGFTSSANFPISSSAPQTTFGGLTDAFVTELNPAGAGTLYSTYLGGSQSDRATGIVLDTTGNAYVSGTTNSTNFPATPGAYQTANGGGYDAFVAKIDRSGTTVDYATYLGGSKLDEANAIAVDPAGNVFITGDTASTNIFPGATSAFQQSFAGGGSDAFVAELNDNGSVLTYGTYLGGSATDVGTGIVVDGLDEAYITGYTSSADFPTTSNANQQTIGGVDDAFLAKFDGVGQQLLFSTYFGGLSNEQGLGIGLDPDQTSTDAQYGDLYFVGYTSSQNFPTTTGVVQPTYNSSNDAFVVKYISAAQGVFSPTLVGFAAQASGVASAAQAVVFSNGGEKALVIASIATTGPYTETDNCSAASSTLQPGGSCTINIVFTPTSTGAENGTLTVTDNAPGPPQVLTLEGTGGNFTLSASPLTTTIAAGSAASFALNVTPANGYTQVVQLTCPSTTSAPLPANTTCVPSPTSLTMNGSTESTATFTVTTTVRPTLAPPLPEVPRGPWTWLALLGLGLAGAGLLYSLKRGSGRRLGWAGSALLLGWALSAAACGGSGTNPGTPPGNYPIDLVGTVGTVSQTIQVTLTVD